MYAVIKTGGKQYKVAKNDVILVEKLPGEAGATVELDAVLMVGDDKGQTVGTPLVAGAHVAATVLEQARGDKIIVFKKKRRKNYRRTAGHKQYLTALRITDIVTGGRKKTAAKAEEPKAEDKKPAPKAEAKKPAPKKTAPVSDAPAAIDVAPDMPVTEAAATKAPAKKAPAKKAPAKKAPAKKAPAKPAAKKAPARKTAAKKPSPAKKPAAKKKD